MAVVSEVAAMEDRLAALVERVTIKLTYKPFAMIISMLGGLLASMLSTRLWRALSGAHDAPEATDPACYDVATSIATSSSEGAT